MKLRTIIFITLVSLFSFSCGHKQNQPTDHHSEIHSDTTHIHIKYAKGLSISYHKNYKLVEISDPEGKNETIYRYALINKGQSKDSIPKEYTIIETPVQKVICMTTLQLSNFIKLDVLDKVVGMTSTNYLFNKQMKQQIEAGKTARIGIEGNFDNELILSLTPDLILVSPFKRGGYESIKDLDIPLVTFLGYKETTPLGQAEWIKFTALLLGMESKADTMFQAIEKRYNELTTLTSSITKKPTVLSGEMRSGNWYVVGGKSYLAQQFRDAGAEYFLKDNDETGGINLDFETVYSKGANADYWRLLVSHTGDYTYDILKQSDARYADFKSFKDKKIVYCNLRQKPFYENTPVEPEVVLADLIKAFYPDLLPDYKPVYYEILK